MGITGAVNPTPRSLTIGECDLQDRGEHSVSVMLVVHQHLANRLPDPGKLVNVRIVSVPMRSRITSPGR